MSGALRGKQSDIYSDGRIVRSLPWRGGDASIQESGWE